MLSVVKEYRERCSRSYGMFNDLARWIEERMSEGRLMQAPL